MSRVDTQFFLLPQLCNDLLKLTGHREPVCQTEHGQVTKLLPLRRAELPSRQDPQVSCNRRLLRHVVVTFANSLYDNGVNPSGALGVAGHLSDEQYNQVRRRFSEVYAGPTKAAKAMILDQGLTWKQISINPEDAEFLASRRFTVEELARLFGCPPPIIGDLSHGTFTNTETVGRWFATHTLSPWIRKIENEFSRSVFCDATRRTHKLEIDMSGFLGGDPAERWNAWKIAVEAGILSPDEVRAEEGWNPRPAQRA